MAAHSKAGKRRFSRLPFRSASLLTMGTAGGTLDTELIDISLKGALVARPSGVQPAVGTPAVLSIHLEDSDVRITMKGTIAHVTDGRLGLQCLSIDVESMIHLRRLMELNLGDPGLLDRELFDLG